MTKAQKIERALAEYYPDEKCGLEAGEDPFRLLVMAILSAQCTDKRINEISPALFARFPDARSIADSEPGELEKYIYSVGLYNSKAKSIRACCTTLVEKFKGKVPSDMDSLLTLGGVGRKVANLIRGDVFGLGGIVADTHCIRISNRLGLAHSTDPKKVEFELDPLIARDKQSAFCHRLVVFGREICSARSPKCEACFLREKGLCKGENK